MCEHCVCWCFVFRINSLLITIIMYLSSFTLIISLSLRSFLHLSPSYFLSISFLSFSFSFLFVSYFSLFPDLSRALFSSHFSLFLSHYFCLSPSVSPPPPSCTVGITVCNSHTYAFLSLSSLLPRGLCMGRWRQRCSRAKRTPVPKSLASASL